MRAGAQVLPYARAYASRRPKDPTLLSLRREGWLVKPRFNDEHLVPKKFFVTPGNAEKVEACPAARVYRGKRPPKHPGSEWGDAIHKFIEIAKTQSVEDACEWIDEHFPRAARTCYAIDIDSIPDGQHEIDQVINVYTGEVWTEEYNVAHMGIATFGRYDFLFEDPRWGRPVPHCVDWKAGKDNVVDPTQSIQLRTYAVGELLRSWKDFELGKRANRPEHIGASIVNVISNGDLRWWTHRFETPELLDHLKRLRRIHLNVMETRNEYEQEGVQPEFIPGQHCKWCDVRMNGNCAAADLLPKAEKKGWR